MVRLATIKDYDEIVKMSIKFAESTAYKNYYSKEAVDKLADNFLSYSSFNKVVFISPGEGMIAGIITQFPFGEQLIATEIVWWVEPDKRNTKIGKELIDVFEDWARNEGCKLISMVSIDDTLGKYYKKRGYGLYEQAYMKEL